MLKSEKRKFVIDLEDICKQSNSLIITHYHGLSVSQMTVLRRSLRKTGASFKIVKNTLSKIAVENAGIGGVSKFLSGPTAIAYSEDAVSAAKSVVEFAKANDKLKIIGGIVNNQVLSVNEVHQLAKLPSLKELRGTVIGLLQAPAVKVARVLQAPATQLARLLQAYADKN